MIVYRFIVPLTLAALAACSVQASAQGAFPAPLPGQAAPSKASPFPPVNGAPAASPFPPVNGAPAASGGAAPSPFPSTGAARIAGGGFARPPGPAPQAAGGGGDACMNGFVPLREDAEKRGKLIKAASDRRAPPDEACKLIGNFAQSEIRMIKYIESNTQKCGIPPQISEQLKAGHKNTDAMMKKVCAAAQQGAQRGPAGPSLSEVLGSANALPEATPTRKSGGSAFDTLNGNVLAR